MKKFIFPFTVLLLVTGYGKHSFSIPSKGDFLKTPDLRPETFARNIISTVDDESGATFTPDGITCYFTMKSPSTIVSNIVVICISQFKNGRWTEPEIASFSGQYHDFNPNIS